MGTIDGRSLCFTFKDGYGKMEIVAPFVARVQKTIIRNTTYYGQVNCVDIGFHNYDVFSIIGGSEDLGIFNTIKKSKVKTLATAGSATGAGTAVRISPKNEYVAYATGSDWLRGLYELESIKKPRIAVVKLSNSDLNDFIAKWSDYWCISWYGMVYTMSHHLPIWACIIAISCSYACGSCNRIAYSCCCMASSLKPPPIPPIPLSYSSG